MIQFFKRFIKIILLKIRFPKTKISFGANISMDTLLEVGVKIAKGSRIGSCKISRYCYIGVNCQFERTTIGPFSSIGSDIICGLATHPLNYVSTYPGFYSRDVAGSTWFGSSQYFEDKLTVNIGADVWIGTRATILGGISVGHGAVIASGAVVTKDIPPYAIVGGVPAKLIRFRFDNTTIENLLISKWWTLSDAQLRNASEYISDVDKFLSNLDRLT